MSEINLETEYSHLRRVLSALSVSHQPSSAPAAIPSPTALSTARSSLLSPSSPDFLTRHGPTATLSHIRNTLLPALSGQATSSRYFGFVTGGILPVAEAADNIVSAVDQNAASHIESHSVTADVEDAALRMVMGVLGIPGEKFPGRIFTTGATGSNVAGIVCGREAVVGRRVGGSSIAEMGIFEAYERAGIREVQVLTSGGHSSLSKAAGIAGIGSGKVYEVGVSQEKPWKMDLGKVEEILKSEGVASIVSVSMGEVNTGMFATEGREEMQRLRDLADKYGAWLHVDGAFGIFVRTLSDLPQYASLKASTAGLELADSITADAHKILNAPYDCGIFFCTDRSLMNRSFCNPNAAYLSVPTSNLISPLDIGIENSRRFRALPIYAIMMSEGWEGIAGMVAEMVEFARALTRGIAELPEYELLPSGRREEDVSFILLVRLRDLKMNEGLVERVNRSREMFVSGSRWEGRPAARIAVSSHKTRVSEVPDIIALLKKVAIKN